MNLEKEIQYQNILSLIKSILKNNSYNTQFKKDLQELLATKEPKLSIENSKVDEIHATVTLNPLAEEAISFYNFITDSEVQLELIMDYYDMELARRSGKISYFYFHMYQQIEHLTNYIFKKEEFKIYTTYNENKDKLVNLIFNKQKSLREFVLVKDTSEPLSKISHKIRMLVYLGTINKNIDSRLSTYLTTTLKNVRDTNHRGTQMDYQKKDLEKVKLHIATNYFTAYQYLNEFIHLTQNILKNN